MLAKKLAKHDSNKTEIKLCDIRRENLHYEQCESASKLMLSIATVKNLSFEQISSYSGSSWYLQSVFTVYR